MKRISLFIVLIMFVLQLVAQSNRYAESSVLSTGDWYKIQVEQSGIYKLTYEQLKEMGIKNPANVSVFGYGGAQLPESFSKPYIDDLPQLSIYIEKGSDGIFGAGDYILFYAQGPINWTYNENKKIFEHEINTYSNYGYYFVTSDYPTIKEIKSSKEISSFSGEKISSFDDYLLYEKDDLNLINSGRVFLDKDIFTGSNVSKNFSFKIANLLQQTSSVRVCMAHTSFSASKVTISVDNMVLGVSDLRARNSVGEVATSIDAKYEFIPKSTTNVDINLVYSNQYSSAYLNYIVLNVRRKLQKENQQPLFFRNIANLGSNINYCYNLSNANPNVQIWDITNTSDIVQLKTDLKNSELSFIDDKLSLKEYVAVDVKADRFLEPKRIGKIVNQNLHALGQTDMVIISPAEFVPAASKIASLHLQYDGITTHIVTPDAIYNEFSSGTPDATAYRRFVKMFYDRSKDVGNAPRYLLLFGDGSFDNRQILKANTKDNIYRLLTYQTKESFEETKSYVTDDYFGVLDDTDGISLVINTLDIAVGRIPASTVEQANLVAQKIENYTKNENCGEWKNKTIFLADDGDDNLHVEETDSVCRIFERLNPDILTRKLYFDSYIQETNAVGEFYPILKKEFMDYINNGVLFVNYMGHSGYNNWANEQILTISDIESMYNQYLPLVVSSSCSFSRFDDFKLSGGEVLVLNGNGGAIATISAARTVYAQPNMLLNIELVKELLNQNSETGKLNTIGDAIRLAKNVRAKSNDTNRLPFVLLGDPAIRLSVAETHIATIDSINGTDISSAVDTVGALGKVFLDGSIRVTQDSIIDETFNGFVHLTIFDKEERIETLCNDFKESVPNINNEPFVYSYYTNPLYVGKTKVVSGKFKTEFIIPKDIKYNFGAGRIVMYAVDEQQGFEANGYCSKMIIGGDAKDAIIENDGPKLKMYLNTPYFKNGDEVAPNPVFIAELNDVSGINTIGSGIGHDIILRLDNDNKQEFVLNNYYKTNLGSYNSGIVTYQLSDLTPGKHKLFFRAWDLQNNSVSSELEFEVVEDLKMSIYDICVYPNPANHIANFIIEHDKPMAPIEAVLYIYDLSGHVIYHENKKIITDSSYKINLNWNIDSSLSDGLYFMKVVLIDEKNRKTTKSTKIFVRKQ